MGAHAPRRPVTLQAWQGSEQSELQQIPFTQKPERHWLFSTQGLPLAIPGDDIRGGFGGSVARGRRWSVGGGDVLGSISVIGGAVAGRRGPRFAADVAIFAGIARPA